MSTAARRWVPRDGGLTLQAMEIHDPGPGELTVSVSAVGMNPIDAINLAGGAREIGYEVSGTVAAIGPGVRGFVQGQAVLAFRVQAGYSTALTIPVDNVFVKPPALGWAEAANLLLAGTAAAEMMYRTDLASGDVVLVHGASGAVGISAVQQARSRGARVIGTSSARNRALLEHFGAEHVAYGPGLEQRVRELSDHVDVCLDAVGTDEAIDVSLALVSDPRRIASSAAFDRAARDGFWIVGHEPDSPAYRDSVRQHLVDLAGSGRLVVPMATTFPFSDAPAALELVASGHAGGKVALLR